MSNKQSGKVAFITGANKGIGLETARGLGKLGVAVVIGSRDESRGQAAAETLRSEGIEQVEAVRFDVTRPEDHKGDRSAPGWALRQARRPGQPRRRRVGGSRLREQYQHDERGDAGGPPADIRDELLLGRGVDAGAPAAPPQGAGRAHRQPVEHPRFAHPALRPVFGHLREEGVRL